MQMSYEYHIKFLFYFISLKFKIYFPKFHIMFYVSKFTMHFPKFLKAKEFLSIEKNLFLVTFATKSMH